MKSLQTWWHSECAVLSKKQLNLILLLLHTLDRHTEVKMTWEETVFSLLCSILAPKVSREEQPGGAQHPCSLCSHPAAAHASRPAALLWRQEFLWLLLCCSQGVQDSHINKYFKTALANVGNCWDVPVSFLQAQIFFLILSSKTLQLTKIFFTLQGGISMIRIHICF